MAPSRDASTEVRDRLIAQRVVPVLRLPSAELTERAVECLVAAGFQTVEITMTTPGAMTLIDRLSKRLLVGAGTVLDLETLQQCLAAGARFAVSPCIVPGMARAAHAAGCAALIGGYTPGEVLAAHREGADIVKVFPASSGGPAHLRALHAVFPQILLCPTGGVSAESLPSWFAAGATMVGVGNDIIDREALESGDAARVIARARRLLQPDAAAA